jgi:cbb3-type cytochrome c oxidase subunit III
MRATALIVAAVLLWAAAPLIVDGAAQHEPDAHRHPEAARLENPVPPDATSRDAGKALFTKHCAECHGDDGKGDGEMADMYTPRPANLTDAEWKHGSSDGEIFAVIRHGVKGTDMKAFGKKLSEHEIWDLVNYIRSIGPQLPRSH